MVSTNSNSVTVFAPATVGNAAVGYDVLGFALDEPGDRVTVECIDEPVVRIGEITGEVTELPTDPKANTATAGLIELLEDLEVDGGFEVSIEKGIPLAGGLGGSAASAVASVVAAAEAMELALSRAQLLEYALVGEAAATGARHADNVTPCLYGGLTLTRSIEPIDVIDIPVPDQIRCTVVYPNRRIDTRRAREVIPEKLPVANYVEQSANLAGFVSGCHRNDLELVARCLDDVLIEPHRAALVPGFSAVKQAAVDAGALGCSISGAGPTIFAWSRGNDVESVTDAMVETFQRYVDEVDCWSGPVSRHGARCVE